MIDQFAFLISEGFKSFYRNKLASFLCVITIFINSIFGIVFFKSSVTIFKKALLQYEKK